MCRYVRGILRGSAWAAVLSFALFGATPSNAGTLTVDFDLTGSTLMLGTLLNVADNNGVGMPAGNPGTQVTGTARVVLTGVDASGAIIDPSMAGGSISGLGVNFTLNQPIVVNGMPIAGANLVGPISITQMGMASGAFDGAALTLPTNAFTTALSVNIDCPVGQPGCDFIRPIAANMMPPIVFPITQMATIANTTGPFAFALGSLGGMATLNAAVMQMNMGQAVNLAFVGAESARNFVAAPVMVPEPVEAGLLMLSVLSLCGVAAIRRQRLAA